MVLCPDVAVDACAVGSRPRQVAFTLIGWSAPRHSLSASSSVALIDRVHIQKVRYEGIDPSLQSRSLGQRRHDAGVVDGVGAGEEATFAVFKPLGEDLVATNLVGPEVGRDAVEVLGGIDADALNVGVILDLVDGAVALAAEVADRVIELRRTRQVQVNELLTLVGQQEFEA